MIPVPDLYTYARQRNIDVLRYPMPHSGSMSIMDEAGACYIGIDATVQDNGPQERVHMGHELGHCETGSFYSIHTAVDCRQRHENKADKWAILKLIPVEALDEAVALGLTEFWELADYFGVTEQFIKKAVCLYVNGNKAEELYF